MEGEAWFGLSEGQYPIIRLDMTDKDIVTRIADKWGRKVYHFKNMYRITLFGNNAIQWMMTTYPFLGDRRRKRVCAIIRSWKSYHARASRGTRSMATCHPDKLSASYGLCGACYYQKRKKEKLLKLAG